MTGLRDASPYAAAEVIAALQNIAIHALAQLLEGGQPIMDAKMLAPLLPHIARPERTSALTRAATRVARRNFILGTPGNWSPYQATLLPGAALVHPMRLRILKIIDRFLPPDVPTEAAMLLPALGTTAWGALSFQRKVAVLIHDHLRTRVLMTEPIPKAIVLEQAFWWHLLSFSETTPAFSVAALTIAKTYAERPGWAGFWEQLLLSQVQLTARLDPNDILDLPLVFEGSETLDKDDSNDPEATRSGWRKEAPDWAKYYLQGQI